MITVKEFRELLLKCDSDWNVHLGKWEHENPFKKKNPIYPLPNIVSVTIQDIIHRKTDDGDIIHKIILEDDFDNEFEMPRDKMIKFFCGKKNDTDLLDFVLYTEDTPGHYNHVHLNVEVGDFGYSDKVMIIEFFE